MPEFKLDALEDIIKARKAKGLSAWKKFEKVQEELAGKSVSDITFTTSYPGQEGQAKQLGSLSGNLHFLLGYVNPAFFLAPYHWRLVDMNLSDKDIRAKKHPANMAYWKESGLDIEPEGDMDKGKPSPAVKSSMKLRSKVASSKQGTETIMSGYGTFVVDLDDKVMHSKESGYVYSLEVVKNSFLYHENLDLFEPEHGEEMTEKAFKLASFDNDVYPTIAKALPYPGSIVRLDNQLNALVTPTSVHFMDSTGAPTEVRVFDRIYTAFDLRKGGDTHPSILLNFVEEYFTDTEAERIVLSTVDLEKAVTVTVPSAEGAGRNVVKHDGHFAIV